MKYKILIGETHQASHVSSPAVRYWYICFDVETKRPQSRRKWDKQTQTVFFSPLPRGVVFLPQKNMFVFQNKIKISTSDAFSEG